VWSSAVLVGKNLIWPFCDWLIRRRIRAHHAFDAKYGLDTQAPVAFRYLEASAPGAQFAHPYEGAAIPLIHKILRRLRIDFRQFTFIDLGSGKGRVLLIASQYPFKAVIGVEFSEMLHNIAQSNITKFSDLCTTKTSPISINIDAGAFDFSITKDKVIFCNNPFEEDLMLKVLDNLELSLAQTSSKGILVYLTPIAVEIAARLSRFKMIHQGSYLSHFGGFQKYLIYQIS
jgi:SAM-dependent methyltransferase